MFAGSDDEPTSNFMGVGPGNWSLTSQKDPRWNTDGRAAIIAVSTGEVCDEAAQYIELKKKELGDPPKDLTYSCMKD